MRISVPGLVVVVLIGGLTGCSRDEALPEMHNPPGVQVIGPGEAAPAQGEPAAPAVVVEAPPEQGAAVVVQGGAQAPQQASSVTVQGQVEAPPEGAAHVEIAPGSVEARNQGARARVSRQSGVTVVEARSRTGESATIATSRRGTQVIGPHGAVAIDPGGVRVNGTGGSVDVGGHGGVAVRAGGSVAVHPGGVITVDGDK